MLEKPGAADASPIAEQGRGIKTWGGLVEEKIVEGADTLGQRN